MAQYEGDNGPPLYFSGEFYRWEKVSLRPTWRSQTYETLLVGGSECYHFPFAGVTTPDSDEPFLLEVELPSRQDRLTLTAVLDGGECLDFPATMVYSESDQSAMIPYNNNPSFCDKVPGKCAFECDCSDTKCRRLVHAMLSVPTGPRGLCEIYVE
ncbi:hypothetical protein NP493_2863g00001 [Ridgeia piscesae]|uniref:Uncharacterized protein n=1 Tax=Ridgeia piscesae TaxID=27915 RepID=A0AAD9N0Q0_RIDPI|nr:hypothetical protein NP493_2863g00001 [Ridgeia piscesae]